MVLGPNTSEFSRLEPLQSNGRVLKPCLVHGDLWEENTATDLETGKINVVSP